MAQPFRTADREERRVLYGNKNAPPQQNLTLADGSVVKVTPLVAQTYMAYAMDPAFKKLDQRFVLEVARKAAAQGSPLTAGQLGVLAQSYGIDPYTLFNQKTGVGGGVNKADTIRTISALVSDMAAQLGIPFTAEQIGALAATAEKQNWSRDQIVDELTKNVDWYKLNSGTIKTSYESYKTYGKQFLVNVSDASAQSWALQIARGEATEETILQSIREAAKAANPWLASYIDQGLNPIDVLSPNRDFIAQNLEISPLELDLMDPKTLNLMTTVDPNGVRKLADQSQMIKQVRTDERWKSTNNAKDLTAGMATLLAKVFGRSVF